jgi:hypothetical protein
MTDHAERVLAAVLDTLAGMQQASGSPFPTPAPDQCARIRAAIARALPEPTVIRMRHDVVDPAGPYPNRSLT